MTTFGTRPRRRDRSVLVLPAGTVLFDPRNPSRRIYRVKRGLVELSSGSEVIFDHLGRGSFFGEKFLLAKPLCGQVARAIKPSSIEFFGRHKLLERLHRDHRFAVQLLRSLAHRIETNELAIRDLAKEPAARRLALFLARSLPDRRSAGWVRLAWNPTNPELGRRIGTTRWRVSRIFNQFQRQGWVRRGKGLWVRREGLDAFLRAPNNRH
jgi:CRP-like cAMP-binding protein